MRSRTVARPAYFRLFWIEGRVRLCPSAASKCESVQPEGRIVAYQSLENATRITPRCGRIARNVTKQKTPVQSSPPNRPVWRGPPWLVAFAIIA